MSTPRSTGFDSPCSDPLWDACRYLAGEMSAAEVELFELRLDEPPIAEALAQAVQLQALVQTQAATPMLASSDGVAADKVGSASVVPAAKRRRVAKAIGSVTAALVMVTVGWYAGGRFAGDGWNVVSLAPSTPTHSNSAAIRPADEALDSSMLSVWVSLNLDQTATIDENSGDPPTDFLAQAEVPEWMFAALATEAVLDPLSPEFDDLIEESL